MLKFIAAVIAAAAIAGVFTFQSAASARTDAVAPVKAVAAVSEVAPQGCMPQPWPYLTCVGASSVRLISTDRVRH
jgi:hypothetical protein